MNTNMTKNLHARTLVELLCHQAQNQPDKRVYTFLKDGETEEVSLTYAQLDQRARSIAAALQNMGAVEERALLLYPPGLEYIAAFFGCLYAGVVAVPTYPPHRNRPDQRLQAIAADAQIAVVLTTSDILSGMTQRLIHVPELKKPRWFATDTLTNDQAKLWQEPVINSDTLAFLQYTSGSTGTPKGVMVSHGNVLYDEEIIEQGTQHTDKTVVVGWIPLFHDMGLIANVLQTVYVGAYCVMMSPIAFLQRPYRWLQAITDYKGTSCVGPNFAYDLCVQKITPEQRAKLDLSSWEIAFSGAEPVRAETLDRFADTFKTCGFRREAFYPCYGMAETTLFVSGGLKTKPPVVYQVEETALEQHRVVAAQDEEGTRTLVGCGRTWLDQKIVIVNPDTFSRCSSQQVGEIWVSGQNVTQGYWNRPEETEKTFHAYLGDTGEGPFLRTGDLGFLQNGELFVTGRLKDLIIIRGRNLYPQDIELTTVRSHPALRADGGAAFSVEINGEEQAVVVQEVKRHYLRNLDVEEVVGAIRQALAEQHELPVYTVLLLKTGHLPKTSSGKVQRRKSRSEFLAGNLAVVGEWRQAAECADKPSLSQPTLPTSEIINSQKLPTSAVIQSWLVNWIAQHLKVAADHIDIRVPLTRYGMDSVTAVSLSGELAEWLERPISPTVAYDYPTLEALVESLNIGVSNSTFELESDEPKSNGVIAIIGIGCRFPGAPTIEAFWQLLREGKDAITEVPPSRWDVNAFYDPNPDIPGKMNTRWGGFITSVEEFDTQFFGISPREAESMDPQQRLLLEVSWETLENAGQSPEQLAGSQTGVFIGISGNDFARLQSEHRAGFDAYWGTGNALSIAANRLSYVLDLHGPSVAVDTACSSSLVAIHQACQSLRQGECQLALAGGVNLILTPDLTLTFSIAGMMAADGRCKTFDAKADGYVRSEGCGMVLLKRFEEAVTDGDNILALIKGSAINQDGQSNGLTAPNGLFQQAVVRKALANASVTPAQISYVEAHGTGTSLGDPIEVNALKEVLMQGRKPEQPCWIGSVKTNLGHLEAAAGIASLIKVVLSLQHQEIFPHLHLSELNPLIGIADTPLKIPTQRQTWEIPPTFSTGDMPRFAGVSSFGFGGTNAHLVLEEMPKIDKTSEVFKTSEVSVEERPQHLFTLSAKSESALRELAQSYETYLKSHSEESLADICFTVNTGRSHFSHRLAMVTDSTVHLSKQLGAFREWGIGNGGMAGKEENSHIDRGFRGMLKPNQKPKKIAFLFTGQGAQYVGMGQQLYQTQPIFRQMLERCQDILQHIPSPSIDVSQKSLLEIIGYLPAKVSRTQTAEVDLPEGEDINYLLNETAYTQPALFAVEYALAELWKSWGIAPDIVMGHSVGEYVAACVAGVFSLEDGFKLIAARGRLMQTLCDKGEMLVLSVDETRATEIIEPFAQDVSIAAINGPKNVVISGKHEAIETIIATLSAEDIKTKRLPVSHAFHSHKMEPMLAEFERVAAEISYSTPQIPLCSNLTGQLATDEIATSAYWCRHVREPVRFAAGMETLYQQGSEIFLEIGPKPSLLSMGCQCLPEGVGTWLVSLRQESEDWQPLLQSLGELYVRGVPIDWSGFDKDYPRHRLLLPTYPWQRLRYWVKTVQADNTPQINLGPQSESFELQSENVPEPYREHFERVMKAQQKMKEVLFKGIDFSVLTKGLDSTYFDALDLIALGRQYPHLDLEGCSISSEQLEIGNSQICACGLQNRIKLYQLNSSEEELPSQYDFVLCSQAIHHLQNKQGVVANLAPSLKNGGLLILVEIMSNLTAAIEHPDSSTNFLPKEDWADLLAHNHLRIVECVDASHEMGNLLVEVPNFDENLSHLTQEIDEVTRTIMKGTHFLGDLLRKKLAIYSLLTVQKDNYLRFNTIRRVNQEKLLSAFVPYSQLLRQSEEGDVSQFDHGMATDFSNFTRQESLTRESLLTTEPEQRQSRLESYLIQQVEQTMKLNDSQLDRQMPLNHLGLDSMMAVQLKKGLETELQVEVPMVTLMAGISVVELTKLLLDQIQITEADSTCVSP